jgi:outer membrane receptor protein involved in Fe transport
MSRVLRHAAVGVVGSLLLSRVALAADTDDIEVILAQPIVTTASKTPETESAAPGTVTVLTSDDIRRYGIHTILEATTFLSLGMAGATNLGGGEIGARGMLLTGDRGDHVLLLINGHAVNDPLSGGARFGREAGIPMELVDHIEVILGPGSVLYGTGAMLSVINVVTKRANAFNGTHVYAETVPFSSIRVGAGMGYELSVFGTATDVTAVVEYYGQDGPNLVFAKQGFVGYDAPTGTWGGVATRSNYAQVPSAMMRIIRGNLEINVRGVIANAGLPTAPLVFDDPLNRNLERAASIDVAYRIPVSSLLELRTRVYADTIDRQFHVIGPVFGGCPNGNCDFRETTASQWAGTETRASFDWLGTGNFVTLLGVDARVRYDAAKHDHFSTITDRPIESTDAHFSRVDAPLGAYAQQTWRATRWLAFNGGVRVDEDARFPVQISPRMAATVIPWTGGVLKATYSQAFRAPSILETNDSGPLQILANHLAPETVRTWELSMEQAFGTQRIRFAGFVYDWNEIVDLHLLDDRELHGVVNSGALGDIPYSPTLRVTQYRNISAVDNVGFNFGYDGSVSGGALRYAANLTGALARIDGGDAQQLPVAPQFFGNARISYDLRGPWPTIALASRFQGRVAADRAFTGGFTPTPYVAPSLELRATITGGVPTIKGLSYRITTNYAFQQAEPYVVGPQQGTTATQPFAQLAPYRAFTSTLGLHYDF